MLPEENAKMSDVFDPFRLLSLKGIGGIIVIHAIPIFQWFVKCTRIARINVDKHKLPILS